MKVWYLEGLYGPSKRLRRIRLAPFPFEVGRQPELPLALESSGISRVHARIDRDPGDRLWLSDLGSTNGTFLNRVRLVGRAEVRSGDILHFATEEFRAIAEELPPVVDAHKTRQGILDLPQELPGGVAHLQELLLDSRLTTAFQPIVERSTGTRFAFEMLARGTHPELPEAPTELFRIAESVSLEVQLSEVMRRVSVELAHAIRPDGRFFVNIHPSEMADAERLIAGMREIRTRYPDLRLVLEVHEAAVAERDHLEALNAAMRAEHIGIAYDDFGVGQSRLMELADVPPDYVKLDGALIRDPHRASEARRQMVSMIVDYARERGIRTIAEGVSGQREARYCDDLAIDFVQGYHFGYPAALEGFA